MKNIFIFITIFIIYGSLYPFNFSYCESFSTSLKKLNNTWTLATSRGDILANITLFVPFGYTGFLLLTNNKKLVFNLITLISLGIILSFLLQLLQLFLPSRDPSFFDAILNIIGISLGAIIGLFQHKNLKNKEKIFEYLLTVKTLLIASWLCYRLLPFIPALDFQDIKNSIKPLFLYGQFSWINVLHDTIAWIVVWYLWKQSSTKYNTISYFIFFIFAVFALEIIIIDNVITLSNVAGATMAVLVWVTIRNYTHIIRLITSILAFSILSSGLYPFEFYPTTSSFHWLPFYGFLQGSLELNTSVIFEKFFLYGSLLYFSNKHVNNWNATIISVFLLVGFIEFLQLFTFSHLAEITDPLLILVFGTVLKSIKNVGHKPENIIAAPILEMIQLRYDIKIIPQSSYLQAQIPVEGISIKHFPFQMGRHKDKNSDCMILENQIAFVDRKPYHLSKNHLTIDIENNALVLRDTSSLGTRINGTKVGGKVLAGTNLEKGILKPGKNEVVLGGIDSDFKLHIIVNVATSN